MMPTSGKAGRGGGGIGCATCWLIGPDGLNRTPVGFRSNLNGSWSRRPLAERERWLVSGTGATATSVVCWREAVGLSGATIGMAVDQAAAEAAMTTTARAQAPPMTRE